MYKNNKKLIFSPSDLTVFLDSPFAFWMERAKIETPDFAIKQDEDDPFMSLLASKGITHENEFLEKLKKQGLRIIDIEQVDNDDKQIATLDAMQQGFDIVYQATLSFKEDDGSLFIGHADYLRKVTTPSQLGDYSYEVWDAKLASHLKPYFIIQLCCYAQMLEKAQGVRPEEIAVILGNGKIERQISNDYYYYYLSIKTQFLKFHQSFDSNNREDPANSKDFGRWSDYATKLLEKRDHLSLVANITRTQIKKLERKEIKSCHDLMQTSLKSIKNIGDGTFNRLKKQSTIQIESRGLDKPLYEVVNYGDERIGLGLLPPHSDKDVFFDIEGFPLIEGGLEYLWGNSYFDDQGNRQFKDFWAHDQAQEKAAFIEFIQWVYARWQSDPDMHIYHYGHYEITACQKLMGRYGVCEHEVDQLLRNEVFIDLYKITKTSLFIGEPRYSIKNVEHLYRDKRDTEVGDGGDSVVVYEAWRVSHDGDNWQTSKILNAIRDYNIDDCNSTQELTDWLRERQKENDIAFIPKQKEEDALADEITDTIKLRDQLLLQAEQERETHPDIAPLTENLAWFLEFHRREAKKYFWQLFDRIAMSHEELLEDVDCIACCTRTSQQEYKQTARATNYCYQYHFDVKQPLKLSFSDYWYLVGKDGQRINVVHDESDFTQGLIVVKTKEEPDNILSLIPDSLVRPKPIPQALYQVVADYAKDSTFNSNPSSTLNSRESSCIFDFLMHQPPNIVGHTQGTPILSTASKNSPSVFLQEVVSAVSNLNNSFLTIQGPPGTGKTYTGARVIASLVSQGKQIAITSNSHKAINNLLIATAKTLRESNIAANLFCTSDTGDELSEYQIEVLKNSELSSVIQAACVVGTTAWGFSRDDMVEQFDYLFVDEAGQVSTANLIAMSRCCDNIVLMGDQMQLGQPIQGSHPLESGLSTLDYLLHNKAIIDDSMGIFLNTSYRMHSKVNNPISDAIYEGKLLFDPDNERQTIAIPDNYSGVLNQEAGIMFIPVEHEGNTQSSDEEIQVIQSLIKELEGRIYTDKNNSGKNHSGKNSKPIDLDDILVVAPYNDQVNKLKKALGKKAKVGTVDKFQGQEAPIVFLSLCASDANESPRGLNFLFDINRINVAISRAKSLAIVVGNPDLLTTRANSPEQMKKINVFLQLIGRV